MRRDCLQCPSQNDPQAHLLLSFPSLRQISSHLPTSQGCHLGSSPTVWWAVKMWKWQKLLSSQMLCKTFHVTHQIFIQDFFLPLPGGTREGDPHLHIWKPSLSWEPAVHMETGLLAADSSLSFLEHQKNHLKFFASPSTKKRVKPN